MVNESATALTLANGSRVLSLPGSEATVRGYAADFLIVDEAARVPDELLAGIRPMLAATGGKFVRSVRRSPARAGSMTCGRRVGRTGAPVRHGIGMPISPEFLAEERASWGSRWYAMEYENVFGEDIAAVFSPEDIARGQSRRCPAVRDRRPLVTARPPDPPQYFTGLDLGQQADFKRLGGGGTPHDPRPGEQEEDNLPVRRSPHAPLAPEDPVPDHRR